MKSYYCEGRGLPVFLEKTKEARYMVANNFQLESWCYSPAKEIFSLVDFVRDKAEKLFEKEPDMLFQIQISDSKKVLFIRVKNSQKEIVTILTAYFLPCKSKMDKHRAESLKWSIDAFDYLSRK